MQNHVFGCYPFCQFAFNADSQRFRFALQQALTGQHMPHLGGADAKSQRAESAVRTGVAVTANDGHAGLCRTQFRSNDVDNTAMGAIPAVHDDTVFLTVSLYRFHLLTRLLGHVMVLAIHIGRRGGCGMINGCQTAIRAAHMQIALFQFIKGLRGRDFVQKVQVNIENSGCLGRFFPDKVSLP